MSSDVKLLSSHNTTAFCAYGEALLVAGNSNVAVGGRCPDWPQARATRLLSVEHPRTAILGFVLMLLGFFLQWFALPIGKERP